MRILVERNGGIGDILMLTPALKELARKNTVSLQCKYPELLQGISYLTPVDGKYDRTIDLNGAVEPLQILKDGKVNITDYQTVPRIDIWFNTLGIKKPATVSLDYVVREPEKKWANALVRGCKLPVIVYVLNSTSPYRTYPIELAKAVIESLAKDNYVIVIGTGWGREHPFQFSSTNDKVFDLSGIINIRQIGALLSVCSLCITSDTGPLHMAAAVHAPCLALFGNVTPGLRTSYYPSVSSLWKPLPCHCEDVVRGGTCPSQKAR